MKIIIVGAGEVGTHLAKLLARENMEITLLDENPERLKDLDLNYDLLTYEGSPTSINNLKEIGVENADLFIGVTPYESVNMTACMIATNLGAVKHWQESIITNIYYHKIKNFSKSWGLII